MSALAACPDLLNHRFTSLQGEAIDLCQYAGRPILVVNTASKCGYTHQFEKLEAMHERYRQRGLVVVGFPSGDFNQEFATNGEIATFCKLTYAIEFPMIQQGSVTGAKAHPFFKQLASAGGGAPAWNFHKYLIAPDGAAVYGFKSDVQPDSPQIVRRLAPWLK